MSTIDVDAMLKRLHLANARRTWRDLCARAEKEDWTYQHLLEVLFSEEVAQRQQTRLSRVTRDAGFPFLKTVDDFDFTFQSTLRISMLGTMLSPDFFTQGQNVVLHGRPGRGKTHLAIAIAYRAIQLGFDARFVTAAELIDDLSGAGAQGRLREALVQYVQPHVLVVDEVGYLAYGDDAANVLFHVVNERHLKRRSMIFTTNKALKKWGRVLHDDDLGDAIVDRVLERGRVLKLDGPSVRSKHVDPADFEDDSQLQQPAEVSGKHRQSFSEPTRGAGEDATARRRAAQGVVCRVVRPADRHALS
jgi:DNA replication protein DnaC